MAYSGVDAIIGAQAPGDIYVPTTDQQMQAGVLANWIDPYFGFGEFVYGKAVAAQTVGTVCYADQSYVMTAVANAAGTNRPVFVAVANMALNSWGWYAVGGMRPVAVNATVAAGATIGVTAAGILGTAATTKYIYGIQVNQSQTYAPTVANCQIRNGSKIIIVPDVSFMFIGLLVSGTGVASQAITAIDPSKNQITVATGATATSKLTLTFTWTGYSLCTLNRPFAPAVA